MPSSPHPARDSTRIRIARRKARENALSRTTGVPCGQPEWAIWPVSPCHKKTGAGRGGGQPRVASVPGRSIPLPWRCTNPAVLARCAGARLAPCGVQHPDRRGGVTRRGSRALAVHRCAFPQSISVPSAKPHGTATLGASNRGFAGIGFPPREKFSGPRAADPRRAIACAVKLRRFRPVAACPSPWMQARARSSAPLAVAAWVACSGPAAGHWAPSPDPRAAAAPPPAVHSIDWRSRTLRMRVRVRRARPAGPERVSGSPFRLLHSGARRTRRVVQSNARATRRSRGAPPRRRRRTTQ